MVREPELQFQASLCGETNTALDQKQPDRPMLFADVEGLPFSCPQRPPARSYLHGYHGIATNYFLALERKHVIGAPGGVAVEHPARELQIGVTGIPVSAVEVANMPKKFSPDRTFYSFDPHLLSSTMQISLRVG